MTLLDALVEQRIAAATARGEFDDLPGAGAPQDLDDDPLVPEEVRIAHRVLKNAGCVPPAVGQFRARGDLLRQLAETRDEAEQRRLRGRLLALDMALESQRGAPTAVPREYRQRLAERLAADPSGVPQDDRPTGARA
ncbi:DUF1992 domain-containing protein [Burkholderia sp. WAC0059]|uniref:DnaJ family domain-containing protein n=1 Tax=Burkholderia sp. WAC0059 TaxID=2066022 RepID=UPI000C7F1EB4|nr:DnaJ family domain-containing protein [Burkholderia sp. WAC0059]PLZ03951.1 DUF1992 domain-containing protein [Burkholderia sp. WAC0059]